MPGTACSGIGSYRMRRYSFTEVALRASGWHLDAVVGEQSRDRLACDAPVPVVVTRCRPLEAAHGMAVHKDLEPDLGMVGIPEPNAANPRSEARRSPKPSCGLREKSTQLSRVLQVVVQFTL